MVCLGLRGINYRLYLVFTLLNYKINKDTKNILQQAIMTATATQKGRQISFVDQVEMTPQGSSIFDTSCSL